MNDLKLGYDLYLGARVEELLEEGTLDEIIKLVESDLKGEWVATAPEDSKTRELIYHELHALNRLQLKLTTVVDNLKFSRRE